MKATADKIPIAPWVHGYDRSWLTHDVIAGLTVWGLIVPEGMAYASLAGLPPQAGLYTILVSLLAYAVFGTSRQLIVSATSATAALVGSTIAALHPADAATYAASAAALVLIVGVLFLLAGVAKLGFVAQFLSRPVMDGFVIGLALFVGVGQLNKLFGVDKGDGNTFQKLWHIITELDHANWSTFAIGAGALAVLFVLPHISKRVPAGLVVLLAAIAVSTALDLAGQHGVEVVGKLPQGLPSFDFPDVGVSTMWTVIPAAVGIVLVAYSEALAVAESFASRNHYDVDPNQELVSFGLANLASGMFGGLVACGGTSATAVNDGAGARTQLSSVTASIAAIVTVVALTPLFKNLPEAVLGALIIHAISHLVNPAKLRSVYKLSRTEFWLGVTALVGVVALDVLQGLLIAMGASLLLVVYKSSRPSLEVLGELPDRPGTFRAVRHHPGAVTRPGVLIVRLDSALYYANASANRDACKQQIIAAQPPVRAVIFNAEAQHELDVTSIEMVMELVTWMHDRDIAVYVANVHDELMTEGQRDGFGQLLGEGRVVAEVSDALALIGA